mmetsp:Transcript_45581/g.78799  ORF Transcript_45581/g.78799 Transcript_45581/m.78799 type:complete len:220 (+) Transcript_45581:1147-1806(+)
MNRMDGGLRFCEVVVPSALIVVCLDSTLGLGRGESLSSSSKGLSLLKLKPSSFESIEASRARAPLPPSEMSSKPGPLLDDEEEAEDSLLELSPKSLVDEVFSSSSSSVLDCCSALFESVICSYFSFSSENLTLSFVFSVCSSGVDGLIFNFSAAMFFPILLCLLFGRNLCFDPPTLLAGETNQPNPISGPSSSSSLSHDPALLPASPSSSSPPETSLFT